MEIDNDEDLEKAAQQAGELLQGIQIYLKRENSEDPHSEIDKQRCEKARVRWPRGFLDNVETFKAKLTWIERSELKTNISYTRMLVQVLDWLLIRTNISLTAEEMLIKNVIFLEASICEALTIQKGKRNLGRGSSFKDRVTSLKDEYGVLDNEDHTDLFWIWDQRNKIHLEQLPEREHKKYERKDYERAQRITERFISKMCQ